MNIERLIDHSEITEALKQIEEQLENDKLTEEEQLDLLIFKSDATCLSGKCEKGLEQSIDLVNKTRRIGNSLLEIKASLQRATILNRLRRYDESKTILEETFLLFQNLANKDEEEYKKNLAKWYSLNGVYLHLQKQYNDGLEEYEESLQIRREIDYKHGIAEILVAKGHSYLKKLDFERYRELNEEAYEIFKSEDNKRMMGVALINIGNSHIYKGDMHTAIKINLEVLEIRKQMGKQTNLFYTNDRLGYQYWRIGDLDKAFEHWKEGYALTKDMKDERGIYSSFKSFGLYYYELGNLEKSLEYQYKALEKAREINIKRDVTYAIAERLTVIGYIYLRMGEYEKALASIEKGKTNIPEKYHDFIRAENTKAFGIYYTTVGDFEKAEKFLNEAMKFYETSQRPYDIYEVLHYLGIVFHQRNETNKAISVLKRSLEMSLQMQDKVTIATNLLELTKIYTQQFDLENARFYQLQLSELSSSIQLATISLNSKIAEATVLKLSENQRDRIKSETIFEQIIEEKALWHSQKIYAILCLCELFIEDFSHEEDKGILLRIKELVEKLLTISKSQNSPSLTCETYWLQSQLSMFDFDSKTARELLTNALELAQKRGLTLLEDKYKSKLETLSSFVASWKNFTSKTASVSEIIEQTELDSTINGMKRNGSLFMQELHKHTSNSKKIFSTELELKQSH